MPEFPTVEEIRAATVRITGSRTFERSPRQNAILLFLVEEALAGRSATLKESIIAIHVFGRSTSFDSSKDSIVRVEAMQLRTALASYYTNEGISDPVSISIPKGGYRPVFELRDAAVPLVLVPQVPTSVSRPGWLHGRTLGLAISGAVALAVAIAVYIHSKPPSPSSVAVLPFLNIRAGPDDDYLAESLTEALTAELEHVAGYRVVGAPRPTVPAGPNTVRTTPGADLLLEGGVEHTGNRVRVTGRLIRAADGFGLWSASWERNASDLQETTAGIAGDIVRTLRERRGSQDEIALAQRYTVSRVALDHYLTGLYAYDRGSRSGLEESLRHFQAAVAADPGYAAAFSAMADAYAALGIYGMWLPSLAMPAAEQAARRSLAVDPRLGDAWAVLGYKFAVFDWNWKESEKDFRRSIELNPGCAHCRAWFSFYNLAPRGDSEGAWAQLSHAIELDPFEARFQSFRTAVPVILGDYERAIREAKAQLRQNNDDYLVHMFLSIALRETGRAESAIAEARRAAELTGSAAAPMRYLAEALGGAGERGRVLEIKAILEGQARESYVSPAVLASVHAILGEKREALLLLDTAFQQHDPSLIFVNVSTLRQTLQGEPEAESVFRRLGLPDAPRPGTERDTAKRPAAPPAE